MFDFMKELWFTNVMLISIYISLERLRDTLKDWLATRKGMPHDQT